MFYDKYKELCAKKGVSPFAAARDLGISSRTQGNWKQGSSPRFSTLLKIADYFGVDVSYFYHDDESESNDDKIVENFIEEMRSKNELTDDENLMLQLFRDLTDAGKNELMVTAIKIRQRDRNETR